MTLSRRLAILSMLLFVAAAALASAGALEVVPTVDLKRYTGVWYEVARLPNRFQRHCAGDVTATYDLRSDGRLSVINACRRADGSIDKAEGVARISSPDGPSSKLEVRFAPAWLGWLPMVWGDYWVIELSPDYSYSVVGTPNRKYLWILARDPRMDEPTLASIMRRAAERGFDATSVIRTIHK